MPVLPSSFSFSEKRDGTLSPFTINLHQLRSPLSPDCETAVCQHVQGERCLSPFMPSSVTFPSNTKSPSPRYRTRIKELFTEYF